MSPSLQIDFDPVDQPAARDALERSTWCALRIHVGRRPVTRFFDDGIGQERVSLYVPAFPLAEWFVENWWALLNEICPTERTPRASGFGYSHQSWIRRHCLRAADSSLTLPSLYFYSDGKAIRIEWFAEDVETSNRNGGTFTSSGEARADIEGVKASIAAFVEYTLDRVAASDDKRVQKLHENWRAIQSADVEESQFCALVGRMGIDPYDADEMTDELASFVERLGDVEDPAVRDLTEVAAPSDLVNSWKWIAGVRASFHLNAAKGLKKVDLPAGVLPAHDFGYALASNIRAVGGLGDGEAIQSLSEIAKRATNKTLQFKEETSHPSQAVRAIVGYSNGEITAIGPGIHRSENRRFLEARSLFHALASPEAKCRLVTSAFSWDQKASRAFAAELLAPQAGLIQRLKGGFADAESIRSLSIEYGVSEVLIQRQLMNSQIETVED